MGRMLILALILIGSGACATRSAPEGFRPPRSVDEIEIIVGTPERPYVVVGVAEANVETGSGVAASRFRARSIQRAADLGADAVIFSVMEETADNPATEIDGLTPITTVLAEIIVWVNPTLPPPPPSVSWIPPAAVPSPTPFSTVG